MDKLQVVPFHVKHLELMQMRPIEREGTFKLPDAYERMERVAKESTQAGTFLYDGRVLFCAGFNILWPGVLEIWSIPSACVRTAPFVFGRTVKHYIERIAVDFKAHRIQATTYDEPSYARWMEFLGFKCEGRLDQYTHDKKAMLVFAKVF